MQIFGIGPLEFLFIIVIMIVVLGPKGMVKAARETGKAVRKLTHSPFWADIVGTSKEVRDLPAKIIKEAGIEEEMEELRRSTMPTAFPQNGYPRQVQQDGNPRKKRTKSTASKNRAKKATSKSKTNNRSASETAKTKGTARKP